MVASDWKKYSSEYETALLIPGKKFVPEADIKPSPD
jgi:hypothetical protein